MLLLMRLLLACAGFRPLYKVLRRDMNSKETLFAGLAGLRGSVSLILAQAVITEDKGGDSTSQVGNTIPETEKGGEEDADVHAHMHRQILYDVMASSSAKLS